MEEFKHIFGLVFSFVFAAVLGLGLGGIIVIVIGKLLLG